MSLLKGTIIVSLKQAIEASHFIEKLIWICLGTLGTVYFLYLLTSQVKSWDENSILVSKWQKSINEIDFPAITFCSQSNTQYAVAERIGNFLDLDAKFTKEKLLPIRNLLIQKEVEVFLDWEEGKKQYSKDCPKEKDEEDDDYYYYYDDYEDDEKDQNADMSTYCEVRSLNSNMDNLAST